MSKTTADRRFAARVFAVSGGVLLGIAMALLLAGLVCLRSPGGHPGVTIIGLLLLFGGAVVALLGGALSFTSVVVRGPHRIGHLVGWVIVPMLIVFAALWAWLASVVLP